MRCCAISRGLALIAVCLCASAAHAIPVTSNLQVWLDAADPTTILDNSGNSVASGLFTGTVKTWVDKSGNGNNAVQNTVGQQFSYTAGGLNGHGILNAARASSQQMIGTVPAGTSTGNISMFTAYRATGAFSGSRLTILDISDGTPTGRNGVPQLQILDANEIGFHNGGVADPPRIRNQITLATLAGNWFTSSLVRTGNFAAGNGSTVTIKSDGTAFDLDTATQNWSSAANTAYAIGVQNGFGNNFDGSYSSNIVYNRDLNVVERTLVENFLSSENNSGLAPANDKYTGDTLGNGNHDFDVIGIGRDVASGASLGGSVLSTPALQGGGLKLAEANGSLTDGEYLLAGHATSNASNLLTTDLAATNVGTRLERTWFLEKTGLVDATITFSLSELGLSPGTSRFSLLYRLNTSGNFADLGLAASVSGSDVSFLVPNASLLNGFYTLGITVPEPSSLVLLSLGVVGLAARRRRRQRSSTEI